MRFKTVRDSHRERNSSRPQVSATKGRSLSSLLCFPDRGKPLIAVGGFKDFLNGGKPRLGLRFGVELEGDWERTREAGSAQRDIFVVAFKADQQRESAVPVPDPVGKAG